MKDKDYWYSIPNFNKCAYRMAHNFGQAQAAREGSTWIPCSNFRRRAMTWQEYKLISRVWCQMGSGASYKPNMSPNTNHLNNQGLVWQDISKRVKLQPLQLPIKLYGPIPTLLIHGEFNNCPTRCDLFSLLHFCKQLYMFRVLTPIIRSSYSCNYSLWYWLTGSTTIRSLC